MPPNFSNRSAIRFMIFWSAAVSPEGRNRYQRANCSLSAFSTSSTVGNPFISLERRLAFHSTTPRIPLAENRSVLLETYRLTTAPSSSGCDRVASPCPSVRLLNAGKKRIEPFSHGRVRENGIAQYRVRKSSNHCHLYNGHHFTGLRPDHRKTKDAIAIRFEQRFHESAAFIYRSRPQHRG